MNKSSLKYRIIKYFAVVSILPLLVMGAVTYSITSSSVLERFSDRTSHFIYENMLEADRWFDDLESLLSNISADIDTVRYFTDVTEETVAQREIYYLVDTLSESTEDIFRYNEDSIRFLMLIPVNDKGYPMYKGEYVMGTNFSHLIDLDIAQKAMDNKYLTVWDEIYTSDGKSYLALAKASLDPFSEDVVGVTIIGYKMDGLKRLTENLVSGESDFAFISRNGEVLVFSSKEGESLQDQVIDQALFSEEAGQTSEEIKSIDNIQYKLFVRESSVRSMYLTYGIPVTDIIGDIQFVPIVILAIFASLFAYILLMSRRMYQDIYSPIETLVGAMKSLKSEMSENIVDMDRDDEFGQLAHSFNDMCYRIEQLIDDMAKEQRLKREQEILALQSQINPHFLYNTLNSIKALVRMDRSDEAISMTEAFIQLLRVSANHDSEFSTVQEEVHHVEAYIDIMNYRYEQDIILNINLGDGLETCPIPRFILQPIVENAIVHGYDDQSVCVIKVIVKQDGDLLIEVKDNGVGISEEEISKLLQDPGSKKRFSSIGLNNINHRIKLNFGDQYGLFINSVIREGTTITLKLPLIEDKT